MTNVSKLHALGIMGKGVQVAIIDSGVDYNHPALGGCFGSGCKVIKVCLYFITIARVVLIAFTTILRAMTL